MGRPTYRLVRALSLVAAIIASTAYFPSGAMAAGCEGYAIGPFLSEVPYFSKKMVSVGDRTPQAVTLAHDDDERIRGTFRLEGAAPDRRSTRAAYLQAVSERLDGEVQDLRDKGMRADSAVFPYDPVSWAVTATRPATAGGDTVTGGTLTVRVSSTCHLVVDWTAPDARVLAVRNQEFGASLSALRTFSERRMAPADFVRDDFVPTGFRAVVSGFLVPLAASFFFMWLLRNMLFFGRPDALPRAMCAVLALASGGAFLVELHTLVDVMPAGLYLDDALMFLTTFGLGAFGAAVATPRATLACLATSSVFGLSLAVKASLSWSIDTKVAITLAFLYTVIGLAGLWAWRTTDRKGVRLKTAERRA